MRPIWMMSIGHLQLTLRRICPAFWYSLIGAQSDRCKNNSFNTKLGPPEKFTPCANRVVSAEG
jgi:hypothetical protein